MRWDSLGTREECRGWKETGVSDMGSTCLDHSLRKSHSSLKKEESL